MTHASLDLWKPIWPAALGVWLLASAFVLWPTWAHRRAEVTWADQPAGQPPLSPRPSWLLPGVLAGVLGASMLVLYSLLGNPGWDRPAAKAWANTPPSTSGAAPNQPGPFAQGDGAPAVNQAQIEAMVARLAQRLQQRPDDAAGWRMLARSYETLGRFDAAAQAYEQWTRYTSPDADGLTDYAVTLGMSQGQTLAGAPEALIDEALRINPRHIQALALSGAVAYEQGDFAKAVNRWKALLAQIPPDADMRSTIEHNLQKAQERLKAP